MSNKQELEQIVNHINAEEVLKKHILSKNQDFDATKSCSTLLDGATAFMHPDGVLKIVLAAMQEYATLTAPQEKKEAPATGQGMGEEFEETKALLQSYADKIKRQSEIIQQKTDHILALEYNCNQYDEQIQELMAQGSGQGEGKELSQQEIEEQTDCSL